MTEKENDPGTKHPGILEPADVKERRDFNEELHNKIAAIGDPGLRSVLFDLHYGDDSDNPNSEGYGQAEPEPKPKPQPRK